ncbi:MAG: cell wall hydrolase [Clostridia bacterium]|nr:cell wall hydrolase [Clostridia bacterium]
MNQLTMKINLRGRTDSGARARRIRRVSRLVLTLVIASILCSILSLPASAATAVRVTVNGRSVTSGKARIVNSTTYVPFRAFANEVRADSSVTWRASTRTATMKSGSTTVSAAVGKSYLTLNGSTVSSNAKNLLIGGTLFVPVRPMAKALGYSVSWDARSFTAALTKQSSGGNTSSGGSSGGNSSSGGNTSGGSTGSYSDEDLYWLSRIIEAEAGGESYKGKLAVGTVIMNRVRSSYYPNTVYGVIFDRRNGVQFTPTANGYIYKAPSQSSIKAAKEVLNGYRISGNIQYFVNPSLASDKWFRNNLTYVCTIGSHVFYAP